MQACRVSACIHAYIVLMTEGVTMVDQYVARCCDSEMMFNCYEHYAPS